MRVRQNTFWIKGNSEVLRQSGCESRIPSPSRSLLVKATKIPRLKQDGSPPALVEGLHSVGLPCGKHRELHARTLTRSARCWDKTVAENPEGSRGLSLSFMPSREVIFVGGCHRPCAWDHPEMQSCVVSMLLSSG